MFELKHAGLYNYRCFSELKLEFEPDATVLASENAGGKTAVLQGLATLLGCWFTPAPLNLVRSRDVRQARTPTGATEAAGPCSVEAFAQIDGARVGWVREIGPTKGRTVRTPVKNLREAAERVLLPGKDWPLLAFYGTQRLWQVLKNSLRKSPATRRRSDGYLDCLDPRSSETQLLQWMDRHALIETQRQQRGEALLGQLGAVMGSMARATPNVREVFYDLATSEPRILFQNGTTCGWGSLSDGYHVFLALVADIARRAVILNDHLGVDAPLLTSGVVLVDEIDLHLHPKWQRTVVAGLRDAFPKLQFVLTTHSPQVLGSVENRQVRRFVNYELVQEPARVQGRDSNAILKDVMGDAERAPEGLMKLRGLMEAIDGRQFEDAESLLLDLTDRWGALDPAVVEARTALDWER